MIKLDDIKKAIRMVENPVEYLNCDSLHKQLAQSLEIYLSRDEFNGDLSSAIECLARAAYDVEEARRESEL
jgi:hypothetical protein